MANQSRAIEGTNFLEGKFLIALPGMTDPRFEKTLIFMCAHSQEGAMGLIVNKPIAGLGFQELTNRLNLPVTANTPDFPVLYGGPVGTGRGFVLHRGEAQGEGGSIAVSEEISLTATMDIVRAMAEGRGPEEAIFVLGYSGWGPGQIENEIRLNGWLHCDPDPAILFDPDVSRKWSTALAKLGIDMSGLSANAGRA